jgi:HK97 gp10 family phage protein
MATPIGQADITKIADALRQSGRQSEANSMEVLVNSANYMKAEMEMRVPVRTGRLRQSIQIRIEGNKVIIGPETEYDAYVEFGTAPHEIRPKNKKALAFKSGGNTIIVKKVNHPGTKAQPYVRPAFEAWRARLGEDVAKNNVKEIKDAAT